MGKMRALLVVLALLAACHNEVVVIEIEPPKLGPLAVLGRAGAHIERLDLLLMIDNSGSMGDKQRILRVAVPDLVERLLNPKCVQANGAPAAAQPKRSIDPCPDPATRREFHPIYDVHLGVVTSSLGGHGADSCLGDKTPSEDDHGRLVDRAPEGGLPVPTWSGKGFLAWDPKAGATPSAPTHNPPGESDQKALVDALGRIVAGAGEVGCGFENQLEAWYRFAIDPDPYQSIAVENGQAVLKGTDQKLLQQRKDFLRPDSLFAVIVLSDENDCSLRDGAGSFFAFQRYQPGSNKSFHLPKPRAACAVDPSSDCCRSCGEPAGAGCDTSKDDCDANGDGKPDAIAPEDDAINLRCFEQKRRFGVDFLQPLQRYVDGLTRFQLQDRFGQMVPNPLFADPSAAFVRDPSMVYLAGIVGVPWQDIARKNAAGKPDLVGGLDAEGKAAGGFQNGGELAINGTWAVILGDPSCDFAKPACRPKDPLMIESIQPRAGTNPVTGDALAPPQQADGPNPINGHEWKISAKADMQYACIFPLVDPTSGKPAPMDCALAAPESNCDCKSLGNFDMKPLCTGETGQLQARAKAYPARRELGVLKALGDQGIVASICPAQLGDTGAADFGYRPAVGAIVERLGQGALGDQLCLPNALPVDSAGRADCVIVEARRAADAGSCGCAAPARRSLAPDDPLLAAVKAIGAEPWNCFCAIEQAAGDPDAAGRPKALAACQDAPPELTPTSGGAPVDGWCYIDAERSPPLGNPEVVKKCPASEHRALRFSGTADAATGATLLIACRS